MRCYSCYHLLQSFRHLFRDDEVELRLSSNNIFHYTNSNVDAFGTAESTQVASLFSKTLGKVYKQKY